MGTVIRVAALHVFPVKSLRGIALDQALIGDRGFDGDRRFMVVDAGGQFLTQRSHPRMALVDVAIEGDALTLRAPEMPPLSVPRRPTGGGDRDVVVWRDHCRARSVGPEAAAWLTRFIGPECELVYMPDESERPVDPSYAPAPARVGFADGFPFLLASTSSLAELARRGADVPMIRFRPNIVVEGAPPFAEDEWRRIRIGDVAFHVVKPCARCSITTVDPATATVGVEPLRTLATFRRQDNEVMFGQNMIHEGPGVVRVGDCVAVSS